MRKTRKLFLTLLSVCCLCFCLLFSACGTTGTYKFEKMTYVENGMTIEIKAGEPVMGMLTLEEDFFVLTLNKDGTATMSTQANGAAESETGAWQEISKDKILLTFYSETMEISKDGSTLILEQDGATIYLKKDGLF